MSDDETIEHGEVVSSLLDLQRRLRGDPGAPQPSADAPRSATPVATTSPPVEAPRTAETVEISEPDLTVLTTPEAVPRPDEPQTDQPQVYESEIYQPQISQPQIYQPRTDEPRTVRPDPVVPAEVERFAPVTQLPTSTAGDDRLSGLSQRLSRLEDDLSGVLGSIESMRSDVTSSVTSNIAERMTAAQREDDARIARIVAERMDAVSKRLSAEVVLQRRQLAALLEQRIGTVEESLRDAINEAAHIDLHDPDPQP
jgi:hypothetical protein